MASRNLTSWVRSVQTSIGPLRRGAADAAPSPEAPAAKAVNPAQSRETGTPALPAKFRYLAENEVFRDLCEEDKRWLADVTTMITCEKGRLFYSPGQSGEVLFVLKRGRVQIYQLSPEGRKLITATLGPGTIFGEMTLIGQGMYDAFAEALEDCTLCAMGRGDLERLITAKPLVALRLLEVVGRRLVEAETKLEDIAFRSVPARLAALLVRLAEQHGGDEVLGLTQQDLADMTGTHRETATQVLNQFKADGLVDIGRKRIVVRDRERLRELAAV